MACELTSGFLIDCKLSNGGIKNVYFTEFANKETLSYNASGQVSVFTLISGKQFFKYEMPVESAFIEEIPQANIQNGTIFYEQNLTIILNTLKTATRNELRLLSLNRLMAIMEDNNGRYWLLGETSAMDLSGGTTGTGTAKGDRNGYELTFQAKEPEPMREVLSSLIPSLIVPA